MRLGVVIFPGSNCDKDLIEALEHHTGGNVVTLWHQEKDLKSCDFIFLPGGFSYGDYLRSGAIAAKSPIMERVIDFANKGGFVMGICNGFQILCETGLLPGALLRNTNMRFTCSNVYLRAANASLPLLKHYHSTEAYNIPIAHGEGRFYADAETLKQIEEQGQVLFRYCEASGEISDAANPNGSLNNIAGVCNAGKNVFGMMPHPERAAFEHLFNTDGVPLFEGIRGMIA
ncbi:MAG: phosphoribosylformylglycinamidine synthase subunit PurQ [Bacteroidetes bacterium]|nr:phosphoribosylformylglycinamidine synthase subunit PurQ [Bacteroidota bacterium]